MFLHQNFAVDCIRGICSVDAAAENAGMSKVEMRLCISELLRKHFGMLLKELEGLDSLRRNRLASEIETAESLEKSRDSK